MHGELIQYEIQQMELLHTYSDELAYHNKPMEKSELAANNPNTKAQLQYTKPDVSAKTYLLKQLLQPALRKKCKYGLQ